MKLEFKAYLDKIFSKQTVRLRYTAFHHVAGFILLGTNTGSLYSFIGSSGQLHKLISVPELHTPILHIKSSYDGSFLVVISEDAVVFVIPHLGDILTPVEVGSVISLVDYPAISALAELKEQKIESFTSEITSGTSKQKDMKHLVPLLSPYQRLLNLVVIPDSMPKYTFSKPLIWYVMFSTDDGVVFVSIIRQLGFSTIEVGSPQKVFSSQTKLHSLLLFSFFSRSHMPCDDIPSLSPPSKMTSLSYPLLTAPSESCFSLSSSMDMPLLCCSSSTSWSTLVLFPDLRSVLTAALDGRAIKACGAQRIGKKERTGMFNAVFCEGLHSGEALEKSLAAMELAAEKKALELAKASEDKVTQDVEASKDDGKKEFVKKSTSSSSSAEGSTHDPTFIFSSRPGCKSFLFSSSFQKVLATLKMKQNLTSPQNAQFECGCGDWHQTDLNLVTTRATAQPQPGLGLLSVLCENNGAAIDLDVCAQILRQEEKDERLWIRKRWIIKKKQSQMMHIDAIESEKECGDIDFGFTSEYCPLIDVIEDKSDIQQGKELSEGVDNAEKTSDKESQGVEEDELVVKEDEGEKEEEEGETDQKQGYEFTLKSSGLLSTIISTLSFLSHPPHSIVSLSSTGSMISFSPENVKDCTWVRVPAVEDFVGICTGSSVEPGMIGSGLGMGLGASAKTTSQDTFKQDTLYLCSKNRLYSVSSHTEYAASYSSSVTSLSAMMQQVVSGKMRRTQLEEREKQEIEDKRLAEEQALLDIQREEARIQREKEDAAWKKKTDELAGVSTDSPEPGSQFPISSSSTSNLSTSSV
ncbi:hypothetical protein ADUPG1_008251, partial [Aduncisulcus paluster]